VCTDKKSASNIDIINIQFFYLQNIADHTLSDLILSITKQYNYVAYNILDSLFYSMEMFTSMRTRHCVLANEYLSIVGIRKGLSINLVGAEKLHTCKLLAHA
jgi:hypothetical protein